MHCKQSFTNQLSLHRLFAILVALGCNIFGIAQKNTTPVEIRIDFTIDKKLQLIKESGDIIGTLECFADDTTLLKAVKNKRYINKLRILGRELPETFPYKHNELPLTGSLELIGLNSKYIHAVLTHVKKDSLRSLSLLSSGLNSAEEALTSCKFLEKLDLSFNNFTKWPAEINTLEYLTQLNITGNQLTQCTPTNPKLKKLIVAKNKVISQALVLDHLPQLEAIDLTNNSIDSLPEKIGSFCPALQLIDLTENNIKSLPSSIAYCKALHFLKLKNNRLSKIPAFISGLPALWSLDLANNYLDSIPESVCILKQLQHIDLSGNLLTTIPDCISKLPVLQELNTDGNPFTSTPPVLIKIINQNHHFSKEESVPPFIRLTQNCIYTDTISYRAFKHPCYNADSASIQITGSFPDDLRFFGQVKKISLKGIKNPQWPQIITIYSNVEEILIDNCVINPDLVFNWIFVQKKIKKLRFRSIDLIPLPDKMWPLTLSEIEFSNCGLTGFPASLCNLLQLKKIFLINNRKTIKNIPDCLLGKIHF